MVKKSMAKKNDNSIRFILIIAAVVVAAVVLISVTKKPAEKPAGTADAGGKGVNYAKVGGEKRPVLEPSKFFGQARAAYEAAKKHPDVLDKLYCWCKCNDAPFNHKSLLSCFADDHGST
jgi:hypothetical protein